MTENMRDLLAQEAVEAEARSEAEERGDLAPTRGQRGRKRSEDPAQVYAVRIPVSRLNELRTLADSLGVPPSTLMRQWVVERLDEARVVVGTATEISPVGEPPQTGEIQLGPRRLRGRNTLPPGETRRRYA